MTRDDSETVAEALVCLLWLGMAVRAALTGDVASTALFLFGIWWIAGVRVWRQRRQRPGPRHG